ncbi:nucleotidyltransferase [Mycoplasma nasistruthionis]|uniref:Nucleotidyltransferase n=1 Tax=Mycoplasma nasistruthionis TaxID=353852 RepID=A0A4Y6I692_9MOLU|nr:nucleotidyltransferase [Mycoplasma nasistruthionis]QCZ36525.1 nucleotidyltransferase [Mycoplasma nasistruthionis]QDF64820.1 nucleotidyltransferase [Mycoplasma nasistruthionis]
MNLWNRIKNFFKTKNTGKVNRVGIVAEYNPFHNGHIYQINWIKENIQNPYIIVILTDKFTQRGEKHIASFKQRSKIAKKYGVNKVIKLSDKYSSQAAHIFAEFSVLELAKQKIDYLVFGSETNNVELFKKIAKSIYQNLDQYNKLVKQFLKKGANSFPRATNLALNELIGQDISMPNDILGLEYVKTIYKHNLQIQPISIQRTIPFHSTDAKDQFASATKIRQMVKLNQDISPFTPMTIEYSPKNDIAFTYEKFRKIVRKKSPQSLAKYNMISEGMENLFKKQVELNSNYDDFIKACTSRRYTSSRIKRAYLSILIGNKTKF